MSNNIIETLQRKFQAEYKLKPWLSGFGKSFKLNTSQIAYDHLIEMYGDKHNRSAVEIWGELVFSYDHQEDNYTAVVKFGNLYSFVLFHDELVPYYQWVYEDQYDGKKGCYKRTFVKAKEDWEKDHYEYSFYEWFELNKLQKDGYIVGMDSATIDKDGNCVVNVIVQPSVPVQSITVDFTIEGDKTAFK